MRAFASIVMAAVVGTTGCLAEDGGGKGAEDDAPTDGKYDSFARPSDHGALAFELHNGAAFTDDEGFHSWTFSLTGPSRVLLHTTLATPNLDTVVYLYKRTSPSASWGQAIDRNDDASEDTAASRLELDLGRGEYRVLVKAYKRTQRGEFAVDATCSGAGCPAATVCEPRESLPADTGYGGRCGTAFAAAFQYASIDTELTRTLTLSNRCDAFALERRAMDFYASYFEDLAGDAELEVHTQQLTGNHPDGGGTLITVGDGGDESAITFLFDRADALVALYQHNQSPDVRFYCREAAAPAVELPAVEDCVGALVGLVLHDEDDETELAVTTTLAAAPAATDAAAVLALRRYAATTGAAANASLAVAGATWDTYDGSAMRGAITASGRPAITYLATSDRVLIEAPAAGPATLVCR